MTEPTSTETAATTDSTTEDSTATAQDTGQETDQNREAAKYRRQLRDTEAERDGLRSTLETMQRHLVEDLARREHSLAKPESLWKTDVNLQDLLDNNGQVDPGKVAAAVTAAVDTLGLRLERRGPYVPSEGSNPGPANHTSTWGEFLGAAATKTGGAP